MSVSTLRTETNITEDITAPGGAVGVTVTDVVDTPSTDVADTPPIDVTANTVVKDGTDSANVSVDKPKDGAQINLLDIEIDSPNAALNVMVGFLGIAQKRGAFAINESAKIFDAIKALSGP